MRGASDPSPGSHETDDSGRAAHGVRPRRAARPTRARTARIRLVLADEHPIVLDGLERLFGVAPDCRVVARCVTADEVLAAVRARRPHVLVIDPHLPNGAGLAMLRQLEDEDSPPKVVLFTTGLSDEEAIEALRLCVSGMVLKEQAPHQLLDCVREVHAGGQWIERTAISHALDTLLRREAATREVAGVLTSREIELVRMVAHGLCTEVIAERLAITRGTVKVHLHHIYRKLKLPGRAELMLFAREKQLI